MVAEDSNQILRFKEFNAFKTQTNDMSLSGDNIFRETSVVIHSNFSFNRKVVTIFKFVLN